MLETTCIFVIGMPPLLFVAAPCFYIRFIMESRVCVPSLRKGLLAGLLLRLFSDGTATVITAVFAFLLTPIVPVSLNARGLCRENQQRHHHII